ncbi:MAG TPA: hypothetical protein VGM88_03290 [Kofleriaceae bacterium]|jgi:hypothetical protein
MYRLLAALLLVACSKSPSDGDLCARRCKKLLSCARGSDVDQRSCTQACAGAPPELSRVEAIEHATCEQLAHSAVN